MPSLSEALKSFSAVVITGGSSGIGKTFIKLMQRVNPELRFCNLSRSDPEMKSAELKLRHISIDLAERGRISEVSAEVISWLGEESKNGRVLLINNSGFGGYGNFPEPNLAHQLEMMDLNMRAVIELTGCLLKTLRERGGTIINVASTAAFQPTAYMSVYGATKAFVLHWSLALDQELRGSGVRALVVCPGPTATEFFRRAGMEEGSVADTLGMTSEQVVEISLKALVKGRSQIVTGWKNKLGVALVTKLPKPFAAWLAAKILAQFRLKKVSS
ncbi:MAG: short-chain dehydrogenase [Opitutaceae bacterium]|nr:short-chain dehydrogenase [Opitutaceae bacterium]|tara:strand:+ start:492 stop:1310 length:819 start_codon:yes stop_codon:yes gene_type:complete